MKKKITDPQFLKTEPAAHMIGISPRFLRQLTADGQVPVHKLGSRCHVYRIRDLEKFMEANRVGGAE